MQRVKMSNPCKICNIRRIEKIDNYINFEFDICLKCIKCQNVYSEHTCKSTFEIPSEDLAKLTKYVDHCGTYYYDRDQITKLAIESSNDINIEKDMWLKIRKDLLMDKLKSMKLQYKKNSICDAYIKYGSPDLKTVVENLVQKQTERSIRFSKMTKYLEKHQLCYNDKLPCFEDYLNGHIGLNEINTNYEIDTFLINETNYTHLLTKYDRETARELAINESIRTHGLNKFNDCFNIDFD